MHIKSPKHYFKYCYCVSVICTLVFIAISFKSTLIFTKEQLLDAELKDPYSYVFKYFDDNQNAKPIMDVRWGDAGKCLVTKPKAGFGSNAIPSSYVL